MIYANNGGVIPINESTYNFVIGKNNDVEKILLTIAGIEKKYSIVFPDVLKEYYSNFDGCKIKICRFSVNGYPCEISKIIPLISTGLSFDKIADNDRSDGFINTDFYPLASNRGGDYYYWNAKTGEVFLVLSDDIENPIKICDSVSHLFKILNSSK